MTTFSGSVLTPEEGDLAPDPDRGPPVVAGRTLRQLAWARLKKDRLAMAGGAFIVVLLVVAVLGPLICRLLGISPTDFHTDLINGDSNMPEGPLSGIGWDHWLGVEPVNGRDVLARILYGARVSLFIAVAATAVSLVLGTLAGVVSGYRGGWIDSVVSRTMDVFLAFPVLLFSIALLSVFTGVQQIEVWGVTVGGTPMRLSLLIGIIGLFGWAYIGRIIRGQVVSLREKEFVEAARSMGARDTRILTRELLPNLAGPLLVYATLTIPVNILLEAALSFLGVGVQPPTASWGGMLSDATETFQVDPFFMIVPGLAIFTTVLAFNLFGDGLRDALDPRSSR
jgi:ABC-type dipeptide/oligopeptide/nickel transport system permease subunit